MGMSVPVRLRTVSVVVVCVEHNVPCLNSCAPMERCLLWDDVVVRARTVWPVGTSIVWVVVCEQGVASYLGSQETLRARFGIDEHVSVMEALEVVPGYKPLLDTAAWNQVCQCHCTGFDSRVVL